MKNYITLLILALLVARASQAQQIPLYNHYYESPEIQNAAYMGADSATKLLAMYRNQWIGINGSPESQLIGISGKIPSHNMGVGLLVTNDIFNINARTSIYFNTSFGFALNELHGIRFGLAIGLVQNRIDYDKIRNANLNDPALLENSQRRSVFDGNFGVKYHYSDWVEVGFSALQMVSSNTVFVDQGADQQSTFKNLRHFILSGKVKLPVEILNTEVSALGAFRSVQSLTTSWEVGGRAFWNDLFWTTILYRNKIGVLGSFGICATEHLKFGYAYEAPVNGFGVVNTGGTHEISLQYSF